MRVFSFAIKNRLEVSNIFLMIIILQLEEVILMEQNF